MADGSTIEANDPHWDRLHEVAKEAKDRPEAWVEQKRFYGDLRSEARFVERFRHWHQALFADGVEATLKRFAAEAGS